MQWAGSMACMTANLISGLFWGYQLALLVYLILRHYCYKGATLECSVAFVSIRDKITGHNNDVASSPIHIHSVLGPSPLLPKESYLHTVTPIHYRDMLCKGPNVAKKPTAMNWLRQQVTLFFWSTHRQRNNTFEIECGRDVLTRKYVAPETLHNCLMGKTSIFIGISFLFLKVTMIAVHSVL